MKTLTTYLFGVGVILLFANCANGKKLQEKSPVALQQVYYSTWKGDAKGAGSGFNLVIPVSEANDRIELDSVYFRGEKAVLETKPDHPDVFIAYFKNRSPEKAPEIIMSSDPKEEYGNQAPVIPEEIPFELKEDEAVVVFIKDGKKGHFKIEGIQKRDSKDLKIKKH